MSSKGDTPKTSKPIANTNKQKTGTAVLSFFVFLTFIIAVGGIGAGYYYWQQLEQVLNAAAVDRQSLKHAISTVDENPRFQKLSRELNKEVGSNSQALKELQDSVKVLQADQDQLHTSIGSVNELMSRSQTEWRLNEVEHILRMSQYRLLLDRDITSAIAGMKLADTGLSEISDVRLIPIRTSISKQIQSLNNFPHPDYVGIQLQIDTTIAQLKSGLIKQASEAGQQKAKPADTAKHGKTGDADASKFDPKAIWLKVKVFFGNMYIKIRNYVNESVEVTHGEHKVAVFIEQQEKKRAYEFLRMKLLAAKYSVSTKDDNAYHTQLNAAIGWLESNEDFTNKAELLREIKTLNEIDLTPELPDISQPSLLLAKYIEKSREQK